MIGLDLKKPLSESLAPNQDAVRDAVNPLKGLQDVSLAIEEAGQLLDRIRQENLDSDALAQYSSISASADKSFHEYTANLDMSDIAKAGDKINAYVDGDLRNQYDKWLSSVPDRAVRHNLRTHIEHDLRNFKHKGLLIQIGATEKAQTEKVNTFINNASDKLMLDYSNENYERLRNLTAGMINSLPINLEQKQENLNTALDKLGDSQIISAYRQNPRLFEKHLDAYYRPHAPVKDPNSLAEMVDGAGERQIEPSDDMSIDIPLLAWKRKDNLKRRTLLETLVRNDNSQNTKKRRELDTEVKNIGTLLDKGIVHENINNLTIEKLTEVYGVDKGVELFNLLEFKRDIAPAVERIKTMTTTEAEKILKSVEDKALELTNSPEFMRRYGEFYKALAESHKKSMDLLQKDSVKWGIENGKIDPLRLDSPESFGRSLSQRSSFVKDTKRKYGVQSLFLNSEDETLLRNQLMRSSPHEIVGLFQSAVETLPDADKGNIITALSNMKDNSVATVALLSTEGSSEAKTAALYVARGAKNVKDLKESYKSSSGSTFDSVFDLYLPEDVDKLLKSSEHYTRTDNLEALKFFILGKMAGTNDYTLDRNRVRDACKMVLGNTPVYSYSGRSINMPPRGMDHSEFKNRLYTATGKGLAEGKNRVTNPYWYDYYDLGSGKYAVVYQGAVAKNSKGENIIADVYDVTEEEKLRYKDLDREIKNYENAFFISDPEDLY